MWALSEHLLRLNSSQTLDVCQDIIQMCFYTTVVKRSLIISTCNCLMWTFVLNLKNYRQQNNDLNYLYDVNLQNLLHLGVMLFMKSLFNIFVFLLDDIIEIKIEKNFSPKLSIPEHHIYHLLLLDRDIVYQTPGKTFDRKHQYLCMFKEEFIVVSFLKKINQVRLFCMSVTITNFKIW